MGASLRVWTKFGRCARTTSLFPYELEVMPRQRASVGKLSSHQMIQMEDHLPSKLQIFAGDMDTVGLSYCMSQESEFNRAPNSLA